MYGDPVDPDDGHNGLWGRFARIFAGMARLAELLGGLVLASDLANNFPAEKVLRTAILATELGRCAGFSDELIHHAYYVTRAVHVERRR